MRCNVFWGSHGCDLEDGHDDPHFCDPDDPCSQFTETGTQGPFDDSSFADVEGKVRYSYGDKTHEEWGDWLETVGFYMKRQDA